MDSFRQYYADEYQFLHEMGQEFSEAYPDTARELGLGSRDPDVERLLQGVAFLTARIRQSLDAEFPELLYPLLAQLWPIALRPTPATVMVEFRLQPGKKLQHGKIAQHQLLRTRPIDGTECQFRTAYPLYIRPLRVVEAVAEEPQRDRAQLRVVLASLDKEAPLPLCNDEFKHAPLRLHLHGTTARVHALYLWISAHLQGLRLRVLDAAGALVQEQARRPAGDLVRAVGFREDETLLPYPSGSFTAYRHLHEYFLFPAKYLFFDVHGLEHLDPIPPGGRLELCFELGLPSGELPAVAADNIRLHCVPAVNLFPGSGRPIRLDGTQAAYGLRPEGENLAHQDIFAIETVELHQRRRGRPQPVLPLYSFQRPVPVAGEEALLYQVHLRPPVCQRSGADDGRSGQPDRGATYPAAEMALSFVQAGGGPVTTQADVSTGLLLTNRDLPRTGKLRPGDLCLPGADIPEELEFSDLGPVSVAAPAPVESDGVWRFASHLLLGWNHLRDADALRELLRLYCLPARYHDGASKRLEALRRAIAGVRVQPQRRVMGRPPAVLYGSHVTVDVQETQLEHPGMLYVFGAVLNHFLADTATLNSFSQLTLHGVDKGVAYAFAPKLGEEPLL